jgi:hypothetical protein
MQSKMPSWPVRYNPQTAAFFVQHESNIVNATPERVWSWLIRLTFWQHWYPLCVRARLLNSNDVDLSANCRFTWSHSGLAMLSEVRQFEDNKLLSWEDRFLNYPCCYHQWYLEKTPEGTRVTVEESAVGAFALLYSLTGRSFAQENKVWMDKLKENASSDKHPLNLKNYII